MATSLYTNLLTELTPVGAAVTRGDGALLTLALAGGAAR